MSAAHVIISNPWNENNMLLEKKALQREQSLTARLSKIAETELREDENTRKECLQQFREWIRQNQDIQNCFTDDKFLLRFLRVKKFSLLMAQQTLLKYLNFRKRFAHIMYEMDYLDPNVYDIISNGYIFASPFRDDNGRRVLIYNVNKFNPHKYNSTDMGRAHAITYETLLVDEENQILGLNHVGDVETVGPAFVTMWSITEFATLVRWGEQSFPMRHKEMNIFNMPTGIKYVYDFVHSNLRSQKLKERFMVYNSLGDLHNKVNKRCLPLEMGGVMPMSEMISQWMEELAAKRSLLLSYDRMNLLSDQGIIRSRNTPEQDETGSVSLPGSFRRLEVD